MQLNSESWKLECRYLKKAATEISKVKREAKKKPILSAQKYFFTNIKVVSDI